MTLALAGVVAGIVMLKGGGKGGAVERPYVPRPHGGVTYAKEVAPILLGKCAVCHRPGQSGPFSLLGYADAKKHARQIGEVTARRFMPPWLPEPGYGAFADERRLTGEELGLIQQLGFIYLRQGRLAEAYREFQLVVSSNPDDYEAYGSLGWICLTTGRKAEAQTYLETALRLNPGDTVARSALDQLQAGR